MSEAKDINVKYVSIILLLLISEVIGTAVVLWLFNKKKFQSYRVLTQTPHAETLYPKPRLSLSVMGELQELRHKEQELLSKYEWINRQQRLVKIPIADSLKIISKQGLPYRSQQEKKNEL
ncbi:MAG: hypothetical protein ACXVCY_13060 [Pseudobdellovibrionaceae bacterium]